MVPGVVVWRRTVGPAPETWPILPDGCLDLVWDGERLLVAGPDSTARWHDSPSDASYVGLRMSAGTGPALLGMPANEVLDQSRDLGDVWPSRPARTLAGMVVSDPEAALQAWAVERAAAVDVDPFGTRVLHMARIQTPVRDGRSTGPE
jgi:hypothetical protein